jgi:hypothetical protein
MLPRRSFLSRSKFDRKPPERGSRRWLIAELDRLTSIIVRRRDRRCVTCGSSRSLQCSHFYSRRYLAIRFNLINCNAMCRNCNLRHNSDPFPYVRFMQEHYGEDAISQLHELRMAPCKITDADLARTLERYKRMA